MADIATSLERIEAYVAKAGGVDALLAAENELYDGVERRLMIISEAAVKLGRIAEALEPAMPWRDIRGIGNALRHAYDRVNHEVIRAILLNHLPPLADACVRIRRSLQKEDPGAQPPGPT